MNGSMDVSTVVFAILAVVVVWKLRSVLGTRTGNERPPTNPFERRRAADPAKRSGADDGPVRDNVVTLPGAAERATPGGARPGLDPDRWKGFAAPGSALETGLDAIHAADPGFAPGPFLEGARIAYEHVILAFAKGDRPALTALLAPDVLDGFAGAIAAREARGETVDTTFVGLDGATIEDAQLRGRTAQVGIRFEAKLITVTRDRGGAVIDGSPDRVSTVVDIWTFARDVGARDPNWTLVATETGR